MKYIKIKSKVIFSIFLFSINLFVYPQGWQWAKNITGINNISVNRIAYDANTNSIITITDFKGDISLESLNFSSFGSNDILLTKYDQTGNVLWSKQYGSSGKDVPKSILTDNLGNIYITGSFSDGANFEGTILNSHGGEDIFLAKISPSGTVLWVKDIGWGLNDQRGIDLAINSENQIFITGYYNDSIMFENDTLISNGVTNNFVVEYNPSGNFIKTVLDLKGSNGLTRINGISLSVDNSLLLTGHFLDSLFFPYDTLYSFGNYDIVLLKISTDGTLQWIRHSGSPLNDRLKQSISDIHGNIYAVGYIGGFTRIDSSGTSLYDASPLTSVGGTDIFVAKYNSLGRLLWKQALGDVGDDGGYGINFNQNLIYITGNFAGNIIFNNDTIKSSSSTNRDAFFGILDENGNRIGAGSMQGDAGDRSQGIIYDGQGHISLGGYYSSSALTVGSDILTNGGGKDGFIAKYSIPFKISITDQQNVTCHGTSNGSATVTPYFGTYPYTYEWSYNDGTADSTLTNVPAGDYGVKVTDANHKSDSVAFTITEPAAINIAGTVTNVSCNTGNDGAITLTITGGTGTDTYLWTTPDGTGLNPTSKDQSGLTAARYNVTVRDENNCSALDSFDVSQPDPITFGGSTVKDIERPPGANGEVIPVVSGGTPAFSYSWEGPSGFAFSEDTIKNLDVGGTYTLSLTDNNGCTADTAFVVNDLTALVCHIDSVKDVSCKGSPTGYMHVTVTGGSGSYVYAWTDPLHNPVGGNAPYIKGVPSGIYYVTVTDNTDSRTATTSGSVAEPTQSLAVILNNKNNITCHGASDGLIDISATGGWDDFAFVWTGPGGFTATSEDITSLGPGTYSVTVTDAGGCIEQLTNIVITEPPLLSVSINTNQTILCNGELTGELEAVPVGGTQPYAYAWNDPGSQTTKKATYLQAGTYTVTTTDLNGCTAQATESLTEPDAINISAIKQDVSCNGAGDGQIVLTVTGGIAPFNYLWAPGNETSRDITGLSGGDYSVVVTDNNNCTVDSSYTITEPTVISIDSVSVTDISGCPGNANGALVIHVTGGTSPYEYSTDGGTTFQTDSTFGNLTAGNFDIFIRDAHSCTQAGNTIVLNDPPGVSIDNVTKTDVSCNGVNDGSIVILASGGVLPYSYSIDGGTTFLNDSAFKDLSGGDYDISVQDGNGCVLNGNTVTVTEPAAITITTNVTASCPKQNEGAIAVTATGGTGSLTYFLLNDQQAVLDSNTTGTFSNLDIGTYIIRVNDENSCGPVSANAEITQAENCSIVIYNAFSPNGDQSNQVWNIQGIQAYPNCVVKIFNSWGNQVFSSIGYTNPWDGTFKGKALPAGTYYYIIDLGPNEKKYSGTVNIIK